MVNWVIFALEEVLDRLNSRDVVGTLYFAGQENQLQRQMKREVLSPRITSRYAELLEVR